MQALNRMISMLAMTLLINSSVWSSSQVLFCENQGQWDEQILYRAQIVGATAWFTSDGVYYQFTKVHYRDNPFGLPDSIAALYDDPQMPHPMGRIPDSCEVLMVKADYVRSSSGVTVSANHRVDYYCNFFVGDSSRWRSRVTNYEEITYTDIYPGIDLKYYGNGSHLEYDIVVHAGADLSQVQIAYEGIESLDIDASGRVTFATEWGDFSQYLPRSYEQKAGQQMEVSVGVEQTSENSYRFLGATEYDSDLLIVDPVLEFSTVMGGSHDETMWNMAMTTSGDIISVGETISTDFPSLNLGKDFGGISFVACYDAIDGAVKYTTYVTGEIAMDVAVAENGSIFVTGVADNLYQVGPQLTPNLGLGSAFLLVLSADGDSVEYATHLPGVTHAGFGIALDTDNCVYIVGHATADNFEPVNPFQALPGGRDEAFVCKINMDTHQIELFSPFGGPHLDWASAVTIGPDDLVYVTGTGLHGAQGNFIVIHPDDCPYYDCNKCGLREDVFLLKLTADGQLLSATCLGGVGWDMPFGIKVDENSNVYLSGQVLGRDFPLKNAIVNERYGGSECFVTKMNAACDSILFSTYISGLGNNYAYGSDLELDVDGNIIVVGTIRNDKFPILHSHRPSGTDLDAFIVILDSTGQDFLLRAKFGGEDHDGSLCSAVDALGKVLIGGYTWSEGFYTTQPSFGPTGRQDAFLISLSPCCSDLADFDNDDMTTVADVVHLIDYLFMGGEAMYCYEEGDMNGDGVVSLADFLFLVDYMFRGGPSPATCLW